VSRQPSVLHVNEAAFTARRMIDEATRRGYVWDFLPKAAAAQEWRGLSGKARRAVLGAAWVARLRVLAARHDIVHVHSASTVAHAKLGAPRYVVHCHGTDVRTAQYEPARGPAIRQALRDAEAVFYSTPDLAEHVLPHRADATYVPVPIDVANIPRWAPEGPPRVLFASRWTADKNTDTQLKTAAALVEALDGRAEVAGLDWGPHAADAAKAGVRLLPRRDHATYLELLAAAHVVVGQAAGILAVSEIEALAAGAPMVVPVALPLYAENPPPVHAGGVDDAVAATIALLDREQPHEPDKVRQWVQDHHGVEHAVDTVAAVHRDVVAGRQ
jgi:glycosyltransferase involved in cell wall biosynthesis